MPIKKPGIELGAPLAVMIRELKGENSIEMSIYQNMNDEESVCTVYLLPDKAIEVGNALTRLGMVILARRRADA